MEGVVLVSLVSFSFYFFFEGDLTYHFLLLSGKGGIVRVKWFGIGIHGHGIS